MSRRRLVLGCAAGAVVVGITLAATSIGSASIKRIFGASPPTTGGAYALVRCCGQGVITKSGFSTVVNPSTGIYCLKGSKVPTPSTHPAVAVTILSDESDWNPPPVAAYAHNAGNCVEQLGGSGWYEVDTYGTTSTTYNNEVGFEIWVG